MMLFPSMLGFSRHVTTKQKIPNSDPRSARVMTENAYGMLKGRWRVLYKKTEIRNFNLRYAFMACIILHNLCVEYLK